MYVSPEWESAALFEQIEDGVDRRQVSHGGQLFL
jgi:hypothetical protein